ncbi:hypothetical protein COOONC_20208 [Cooperia oncophora]
MIKRTMERTVTEEDLHTAEPVRTPAGLEDAGCKTASLPEPVEAKPLHQAELEKHTERERQTLTVDDECRTASELMPAQDDGCRTASEPTPRALVSAQKPQDYAPSRTSSEKTTEIMIKRTMERTVTEEDLHTAEPVRTPAGLEDAGCKTASLPEHMETRQPHQSEVEKHTKREREAATVVSSL